MSWLMVDYLFLMPGKAENAEAKRKRSAMSLTEHNGAYNTVNVLKGVMAVRKHGRI